MGNRGLPLEGIRVVELATGTAGPYAGRLLADHGADVIKVEPAGGDPSRRESPRPGHRPDPERSPLFVHLNANKRGVVAGPGDPLVVGLLAGADLVLQGGPAGVGADHLSAHGIDVDALRASHPRLVITTVSPFGSPRAGNRYAGWLGGDLVTYAMGGPMQATGHPDREPTRLAGSIVAHQCGSAAALASMAGLTRAAATGRGSEVDVSGFEVQAASIDRRAAFVLGYQFTGRTGRREGGGRISTIPAGVYPTLDGYCQIVFAPNWMPRVVEMLDHEPLTVLAADPDWQQQPEAPDVLNEALFLWTLGRTKQQAMAEAQSRGLAITPLNTTVDILTDPHFEHRAFFVEATHPALGPHRMTGPAFRMDDGWRLRRAAPLLGQHDDEIRAEMAAAAGDGPAESPAVHADPASEDRLPLAGIRVLDLTVVWAGPLCTTLLGDLGAEVIRIDNPNLFPTATRGAIVRPRPGHESELGQLWGAFPDGRAGERPWNRTAPFVCHARGKKGATLDLRTELGRETFLRLVEESDVLVENNSVKVLGRLGLDWDVLRARNPRLILLRLPSLGLDGPYSQHVGFGAHMEALCGLSSLRGYLDSDPTVLDATYFMDPASGVTAAFALLCALRRRERTGEGELVELAQAENLARYIGDHLIDASVTGEPHPVHGNRHPHRAPQGVYPTVSRSRPEGDGDDRWIAVSVPDDAAWASLVGLMGDPAWATTDPGAGELATEDGRRARHDELDERIAMWTRGFDNDELAARLQAVGVAAAPVLDEADLLAEPALADWFRENSSADVPPTRFCGHLWRWDGPDLAWGRLNMMGWDNDEVYRDLLGLDDESLAALAAERHLATGYLDEKGDYL